MIRVFRNIRKQLAGENKPAKYLRYAIGEVVLIMLGIFMALQLQNWNEIRKDEKAYLEGLEQIYNGLLGDQSMHLAQKEFHINQIHLIDSILDFQEAIDPVELPALIIRASLEEIDQSSLVSYYFERLKGTQGSVQRNELTKNLSEYNKLLEFSYSYENRDVESFFKELSLEFPRISFNYLYSGQISIDHLYSIEDGELFYKNENRKKLRSILTNFRNQHGQYALSAEHAELLTNSLIKQIKLYDPGVRRIFTNVGIIGTAINGWDTEGARSTPMIKINNEENIWRVTLQMSEGLVKFRCNDAWFQDWGGVGFPVGVSEFKGSDIKVLEAGWYEVTFKIDAEVYEFKKIESPEQ